MPVAEPISIHLWEFPADSVSFREPPPWLGADDRARWLAMGSAKRRREFAAGRRLLWHALQCHGGDGHWRLEAPADRPPSLVSRGLDRRAAPAVSLSHSAGLVACAIGAVSRLGIDVERIRPRPTPIADLAGSVLHPSEWAAMTALAEDGRLRHFYRCWTLKEALSKALAVGLGLPMREFAFAGDRLVAWPHRWPAEAGLWRFATREPTCDAVLGIAWTEADEHRTSRIEVMRVEGPLEWKTPTA